MGLVPPPFLNHEEVGLVVAGSGGAFLISLGLPWGLPIECSALRKLLVPSYWRVFSGCGNSWTPRVDLWCLRISILGATLHQGGMED